MYETADDIIDLEKLETLTFYFNNSYENFRSHFPEIKDLQSVTVYRIDQDKFQINFIFEDSDKTNIYLLGKPTIH